MSSSIVIFILALTNTQSNKNTISCPKSPPSIPDTCTLNCDATDSCNGYTLNCRDNYPCVINCMAQSACADGTIINANLATDVTVICNATNACKTGINIACGTGNCLLECSNTNTACEDFGNINISRSTSFHCIGDYCPLTLPILATISPSLSPTNYPTKYPTISPSQNPTQNHTPNPTQNPIRNPTQNPIQNPTHFPTQKPTITPTYTPTINPNPHIHHDEISNDLGLPSTNNPTQLPHSTRVIDVNEATTSTTVVAYVIETETQTNYTVYGIICGMVCGIILIAFCVKIVLIRREIDEFKHRKESLNKKHAYVISPTIPSNTNIETPTIQSNQSNQTTQSNQTAQSNETVDSWPHAHTNVIQHFNPPQLKVFEIYGHAGMYANNQSQRQLNIIPPAPTYALPPPPPPPPPPPQMATTATRPNTTATETNRDSSDSSVYVTDSDSEIETETYSENQTESNSEHEIVYQNNEDSAVCDILYEKSVTAQTAYIIEDMAKYAGVK